MSKNCPKLGKEGMTIPESLRLIAFRVSKIPELDLKTLFEYLKPHYKQLVCSVETEPVLHIHGIVSDVNNGDENRALLRNRIQELYPGAKGNKHLYTSSVKSNKQIFKYTIKEGYYLTKGYPQQYVLDMYLLSTPKENVKDKFLQLEEDLLLRKISFEDFKQQYIQIKIDHSQNLYQHHLKSYFNRFMLKSGYMSISDFILVNEL